MKLNEEFVRSIKPLSTQEEYVDGDGLSLLVIPDGEKIWAFKYKHKGVITQGTLGGYPKTTLALARQRKDAAKLLAKEDVNLTRIEEQRKNKPVPQETEVLSTTHSFENSN
jgi:hypothetical protein